MCKLGLLERTYILNNAYSESNIILFRQKAVSTLEKSDYPGNSYGPFLSRWADLM